MNAVARGKHLIQLTQTFPVLGNAFPINTFFVREQDGLTLIDTGMNAAGPILAAAQRLGAPIRRIALTHVHQDHAGSLDALHLLLPEAEVLAGERESRFMAGARALEAGESGKLRGSYITLKTFPTRLLREGDKVGSLRVITAPGHTPGQIAFLDERDASLIAGDALQVRGGVAVSGTLKWGFPFPAWATWSKQVALETAHKLRALNPSRLAVGHGETLENPQGAMDAAIAEAERGLRA